MPPLASPLPRRLARQIASLRRHADWLIAALLVAYPMSGGDIRGIIRRAATADRQELIAFEAHWMPRGKCVVDGPSADMAWLALVAQPLAHLAARGSVSGARVSHVPLPCCQDSVSPREKRPPCRRGIARTSRQPFRGSYRKLGSNPFAAPFALGHGDRMEHRMGHLRLVSRRDAAQFQKRHGYLARTIVPHTSPPRERKRTRRQKTGKPPHSGRLSRFTR